MADNYNRLLNNDSGSNYKFADNIVPDSIPRSGFNWSYVTTGTTNEGFLLPVMAKMTLPKSDYELNLQSILKVVNPPKVPLLSRQRVFYHAYWCSFTQLWKGAQTFFKMGTSNIATATTPRTIPTIKIPVSYLGKGYLFDYLGFNFGKLADSGTVEIPALKFMMYLKIYRDFYMNKRLFAANLQWYVDSDVPYLQTVGRLLMAFFFPDDESDFRIGSQPWIDLIEELDSGSSAVPILHQFLFDIKYRDYAPDYFTSAQLTPILGNEPSIHIDLNNIIAQFIAKSSDSLSVNPLQVISNGNTVTSGDYNLNSALNNGIIVSNSDKQVLYPLLIHTTNNVSKLLAYDRDNSSVSSLSYSSSKLASSLNNSVGLSFSSGDLSGITQEAIRELASSSAIAEKLAKTDGSYREFAKIIFGENPKSAFDYSPILIGGSMQSILYSDVVNTTGSFTSGDTPTATSPVQGSMTGKGISAASGSVGRFHSDDFGYLFVIMSIMPDTYYNSGWDRTDCYSTPEDFYFPDKANLGMQAILNKEIWFDAYNTGSNNHNDEVFGYQNRFDELRYCQNEVHGKVADKNNKSFHPYIQQRDFTSLPTLTQSFVTTKNNISKDWLTSSDEVPFIYQIAFNFRGVAPLPYRAQPSYLGL